MTAANECVRAETPETDALAHVPCPEGELFHEWLFKKYRDKARELELRLASVTKERDEAIERAASLVECEHATTTREARRLKEISQHIRDLKDKK